MARNGWLGITMPEDVGGRVGGADASIMRRACSASGDGHAAASAIHINLFGPMPLWCTAPGNKRPRGLNLWCKARIRPVSA
ncbi:MAG: hypothetical protein Q7J57_17750 [Gemmobacter sp.]|nr:hypothetical protein [Gemmobacter sp.]